MPFGHSRLTPANCLAIAGLTCISLAIHADPARSEISSPSCRDIAIADLRMVASRLNNVLAGAIAPNDLNRAQPIVARLTSFSSLVSRQRPIEIDVRALAGSVTPGDGARLTCGAQVDVTIQYGRLKTREEPAPLSSSDNDIATETFITQLSYGLVYQRHGTPEALESGADLAVISAIATHAINRNRLLSAVVRRQHEVDRRRAQLQPAAQYALIQAEADRGVIRSQAERCLDSSDASSPAGAISARVLLKYSPDGTLKLPPEILREVDGSPNVSADVMARILTECSTQGWLTIAPDLAGRQPELVLQLSVGVQRR